MWRCYKIQMQILHFKDSGSSVINVVFWTTTPAAKKRCVHTVCSWNEQHTRYDTNYKGCSFASVFILFFILLFIHLSYHLFIEEIKISFARDAKAIKHKQATNLSANSFFYEKWTVPILKFCSYLLAARCKLPPKNLRTSSVGVWNFKSSCVTVTSSGFELGKSLGSSVVRPYIQYILSITLK